LEDNAVKKHVKNTGTLPYVAQFRVTFKFKKTKIKFCMFF